MHRQQLARLRKVVAALATATMLTGAASCGSVVSGQAVRPKPDVSGLEVGNYPTEPIQVGTAKDKEAARYREGERLGDFVALPFEADPALSRMVVGTGGPVVLNRKDMQALVINDTFDEVAADLTAGWVHTWATDDDPATAQEMSIAVLMFPDAPTAERVAAGLEHDDFTFNTDNRPVQLPKYPHAKAHWRPGVASLGSWTNKDRYVVFAKFDDNSNRTDLPAMIQRTESLLDIQMPLLDEFEPTPADQLENIDLDPDRILTLALPKSEQIAAAVGPSSTFRGRGALHFLGLSSLEFLDKGQVSAIALAETVVIRSKSGQGADALWELLRPDDASDSQPIAAPTGIDGRVECFQRKVEQYQRPSSFCVLQTGNYFAHVEGVQIQDLHQKTSAQYTLLAR
ncbi:DUF7373 family lipoprotein [Nocardia sp. CA-290969]|uniref:DUF7373 family lipoprotein n=1 Tax=Nocardia sp. CA-290969 TaxID=3239986 RepID=UPI003D923B26